MTSVVREADAGTTMADVERAVIGDSGRSSSSPAADVGQLTTAPSAASA
jgi:hypothetical protein